MARPRRALREGLATGPRGGPAGPRMRRDRFRRRRAKGTFVQKLLSHPVRVLARLVVRMLADRGLLMGLTVVLLAVALAGCTEPAGTGGNQTGGGGTGTGGSGVTGVKLHCSPSMTNTTAAPASAAEGGFALAPAQDLASADAPAEQNATGGLVIGTMLPLTGSLSAFGPDGQNATKLAVDQINAAGGVNGAQVRLEHADDKSTGVADAPQTFQGLRAKGASAVIGGYASSVTGAFLNSAVTNKVMVVTPASTSPGLVESNNQGYFLRVPPSDALQGKVLGQVVWDDGCRSATVLHLDNAYGQGLARVFREKFTSLGGVVKNMVAFGENAQTFTSEVQRAGADNSDAVVLVAYPGQGSPVMRDAFQRGIMAKSVFFFSEGVQDPKFVTDAGKDAQNRFILAGLRGTAPGDVQTLPFGSFNQSFSERFGHAPALFAKEAYDATWMIALAAQCAGSNGGEAIKNNIRKVANQDGPTDVPVSGGNVTAVSGALQAARLPGCNINYQGAAHDFNFDANGDPTEGVYGVWEVQADGSIKTVRTGVRP